MSVERLEGSTNGLKNNFKKNVSPILCPAIFAKSIGDELNQYIGYVIKVQSTLWHPMDFLHIACEKSLKQIHSTTKSENGIQDLLATNFRLYFIQFVY